MGPIVREGDGQFETRLLHRRVGCELDSKLFRHTSRKGPGDHSRVRIKIIANSEAIAVRFQNICIT